MECEVTKSDLLRVVAYAHRRLKRFGCNRPEVAEDLAFAALERHVGPRRMLAFDEDKHPDVFSSLRSMVNGLVINWLRKHSTRNEASASDDLAGYAGAFRSAETTLEQRRRLEAICEAVRERFADDEILLRMFELFLCGMDRPAEQAKELGVAVQTLRNPTRRLHSYFRQIADAVDERMPQV
jgi:hypothetical protein